MKKSGFNLLVIGAACSVFLFMFSSCVSTPKPDPVAEEWMQKYPLNDLNESFSTKRSADVIIAETKKISIPLCKSAFHLGIAKKNRGCSSCILCFFGLVRSFP